MLKYFLIIFCLFVCSCSSGQDKYENYKTPYQYQNQYAPRQQYQPYYIPNSRAYTNPYALPSQYATPYYDTDQYYVPPTDYYNIERNQSSPASNKY